MSNKIMKTLTINGTTYQVYDERVDAKADQTAVDILSTKASSRVIEKKKILSSSWTALADSSPYKYKHKYGVYLANLVFDSTSIELLNDQPILFAKYGFAIASVSGSIVEIYSVDQPSVDVTLSFEIEKPIDNLITFDICYYEDSSVLKTLKAEKGMTWAQWVNSEYNTMEAYIGDGDYMYIPKSYTKYPYDAAIVRESGGSGGVAVSTEEIIANHSYTLD